MSDVPVEGSFSDRKRQAVLRGAAEIFVEQGFAVASMDRIAAAAGVSKRTVYKHFRSKRELFDTFITTKWAELIEWPLEKMDPKGDPSHELERFATEMLARLLNPNALKILRMVVAEFLRSPELGRDFFQKTRSLGLDELSAYLEGATRAGLMRVEDPALAAGQFHALIKDSIFWPRMMGMMDESNDETELERLLHSSIDLFVARYGVH